MTIAMDLSPKQIAVLDRMHRADLEWVADATERAWRAGETYYIDSRCKCSARLRAAFNRVNIEADHEFHQP